MKTKKHTRRSPKRRRSVKTKKHSYRIRHWREYNAALVQRGSLTLWIDQAVLSGWLNQQRTGKRGASNTYTTYTDVAIVAALTLKVVYRLPLRATAGLLASLLKLMGVDGFASAGAALQHVVPHYSTLCRRQKNLEVALPRPVRDQALHLVVDSTGLKVYGEGEWKVRQHGWSKHRTWRKVHLGVDEASGELLAVVVSTPLIHEKDALTDLLAQVDALDVTLAQVSGDGGYDFMTCHRDITLRGARATIPPRRNACPNARGETPQRDAVLGRMQELAGHSKSKKRQEWARQRWKEESGYHRRSLVETAVFRLKHIFGEKLSSRDLRRRLMRCCSAVRHSIA